MKKLLVIIGTLLAAITCIFGINHYRAAEQQQAYLESPDKVADDLVNDLTHADATAARGLFTRVLQSEYSVAYWEHTFFPRFRGYTGSPHQVGKRLAADAVPGEALPYPPPAVAWQYQYDFWLDSVPFRVTFVVVKEKPNQAWQVNELSGAYLP